MYVSTLHINILTILFSFLNILGVLQTSKFFFFLHVCFTESPLLLASKDICLRKVYRIIYFYKFMLTVLHTYNNYTGCLSVITTDTCSYFLVPALCLDTSIQFSHQKKKKKIQHDTWPLTTFNVSYIFTDHWRQQTINKLTRIRTHEMPIVTRVEYYLQLY